uniref:Uncharacterized protein n=1 Tax=Cannabis sativa TaxID=3483 RepID=A0A803NLF4_CANSA
MFSTADIIDILSSDLEVLSREQDDLVADSNMYLSRLRDYLVESQNHIRFLESSLPPEPDTPSYFEVVGSSLGKECGITSVLSLVLEVPKVRAQAHKIPKRNRKYVARAYHCFYVSAGMTLPKQSMYPVAPRRPSSPYLPRRWGKMNSPSYLAKGVAFSKHIIVVDATLPLHPFFVDILASFGIAPLQLPSMAYVMLTCFAISFKGESDGYAPSTGASLKGQLCDEMNLGGFGYASIVSFDAFNAQHLFQDSFDPTKDFPQQSFDLDEFS